MKAPIIAAPLLILTFSQPSAQDASRDVETFGNVQIERISPNSSYLLHMVSEKLARGESYFARGFIDIQCFLKERAVDLTINTPDGPPIFDENVRVRMWSDPENIREFVLSGIPSGAGTSLSSKANRDVALRRVFEIFSEASTSISFEFNGQSAALDAHQMPTAWKRFLALCPWDGSGSVF